ncbi:ubiquitin specific protease 2 isoform X4 [Musca autumnalis]|uniref:ubiquitin specific protease 2 isoform X4 n=1 Tax=Musca autumnalis TaxID=221902 RepID=UPI003CFA2EAB
MIQLRSADMESGLNEAGISNDIEERGRTTDLSNSTSTIANDTRSRNRYSRLYSRNDTDETDNISSAIRSSSATALYTSASAEDVPTITLSRTRLRRSKPTEDKESKKTSLKNGTTDYDSKPYSSLDRPLVTSNGIDTVVHIKLNKLNVNDYNANNENSKAAATQDEKTDAETTTSNHHNNSLETPTEDNDDSNKVRTSSTLRSTHPPASPTSSRYWERDSSRSSLISSSTSHTDENKKYAVNDEETEGLCGLRNIGNTCFMNSVIQCLSHTNELTKYLRNYNATKSPTSKDQQILYEFSKLIKEMWTNNVHSVTPMELKRSFSAKHRMYSDYNQQDAQEFLRFFLDSLHCALNSGVKGEVLKIDDNLSDNKKAELTWEWYSRLENSLIRDLFVGQLKSTLRCTVCGNASVTFDPFWDLSVPLPSSSRCKLEACLDLFIKEEVLDGDEMPTCSKCQTRRKCTKSFTIQRFPKYLVIHLKRFSETRWSKLSNIVEFPTGERELNMGPYGANANSNMYFSLYAISNHMGSTAGGHYVAICKHPVSKKWHEFNDNLVSESLSENHLVSSSAYILFYERA